MESHSEEQATYVLFGNEAINIFKVSPHLLIASEDINYDVGEFYDIKTFVQATNVWDAFLEIDKAAYLKLARKKKRLADRHKEEEKRKKSIFRFFR